MSAGAVRRMLLRCYPVAWRSRYGDELEELIVESSRGRRVPLRIWLDVAIAGVRERLRASGLTGDAVPPSERSRAGTLLVLCAWSLFAIGGMIVQKTSEHWQSATPPGSRGIPSAAFDTLLAAAVVGTSAIVAGIACASPAVVALARSARGRGLRRPLRRALAATALAGGAGVVLVAWAHRLTTAQRDGRDLRYELGFGVSALLVVLCLAAWTALAVDVGRRVELAPGVLRLEAWLAATTAATMIVMSIATALWWAAVPGLQADRPLLVAALTAMLVATAFGSAGARRAVRALPRSEVAR
jgi:hypothetical protein